MRKVTFGSRPHSMLAFCISEKGQQEIYQFSHTTVDQVIYLVMTLMIVPDKKYGKNGLSAQNIISVNFL